MLTKFAVFGLTATTNIIIAAVGGAFAGAAALKLGQKLAEDKKESVEVHTKRTTHSQHA